MVEIEAIVRWLFEVDKYLVEKLPQVDILVVRYRENSLTVSFVAPESGFLRAIVLPGLGELNRKVVCSCVPWTSEYSVFYYSWAIQHFDTSSSLLHTLGNLGEPIFAEIGNLRGDDPPGPNHPEAQIFNVVEQQQKGVLTNV
jgi:hypothetical protein